MLVQFFTAYEGSEGHFFAWYECEMPNLFKADCVCISGKEWAVKEIRLHVLDVDKGGRHWVDVTLDDYKFCQLESLESAMHRLADDGWRFDNISNELREKFANHLFGGGK